MNLPLAASPVPDRRRFRAVNGDYGTSIAASAHCALLLELDTWPKPGLVSHVDSGSHLDMTSETFRVSADSLRAYFRQITVAGAQGAPMSELRQLGPASERTMLTATQGVNTHGGQFSVLVYSALQRVTGRKLTMRLSRGDCYRPLGPVDTQRTAASVHPPCTGDASLCASSPTPSTYRHE